MITNILTPFQGPDRAASAAAKSDAAAPSAAITDSATLGTADSGSGLSGMKRAALALMAGATLVGGGLVAPTAANAQQLYTPPGVSQPVMQVNHRQGGNGAGEAIVGGIIGGVIGGVIGGAIGGSMPPPVMYPPVVPGYGYGYNAVGCDGVLHHFDNYGNVHDASGFYRLQVGPYGQCYRTPPYY